MLSAGFFVFPLIAPLGWSMPTFEVISSEAYNHLSPLNTIDHPELADLTPTSEWESGYVL